LRIGERLLEFGRQLVQTHVNPLLPAVARVSPSPMLRTGSAIRGKKARVSRGRSAQATKYSSTSGKWGKAARFQALPRAGTTRSMEFQNKTTPRPCVATAVRLRAKEAGARREKPAAGSSRY